jgi:hypothetical protein
MEIHWAWLIVAAQLGVAIGIFLVALMQANRERRGESEGGQ